MLAWVGPTSSFFVGGSTYASIPGGINRFIDLFEYLPTSTGKTMRNYIILHRSLFVNVFKMFTLLIICANVHFNFLHDLIINIVLLYHMINCEWYGSGGSDILIYISVQFVGCQTYKYMITSGRH